jgi:hypothetical protein
LKGLLAYVLALLAACSGKGLDGSLYRNGGVAFRIGLVPTEWRRIDMKDVSLAFRDDAHEATIFVNARCGAPDDDAPLGALTAHLLMGTTDREFLTEETVSFDAREAKHSVLHAKLDGVLMAYDVYVMKKNGCIYDLVLVAAPETFAQSAAAFERFAVAFHANGAGAS